MVPVGFGALEEAEEMPLGADFRAGMLAKFRVELSGWLNEQLPSSHLVGRVKAMVCELTMELAMPPRWEPATR